MIVPEGGQMRRLNIKVIWLKIAAAALALFLALAVISMFSYAKILSKALERDRLAAENERLKTENQRIVELAAEVELNRKSLERIVRSLGGELDLKKRGDETTQ